ncbi:hypothetical protein QP38_0884 [Levilactobacillus brevis]|nr:hypothetical protein N627_1514 [Levilactobacillus brevis]KIO98195.1 hypothetical protein QP38_0884 [Levilactobacillus brevis]
MLDLSMTIKLTHFARISLLNLTSDTPQWFFYAGGLMLNS